jgi:hypothetical protein
MSKLHYLVKGFPEDVGKPIVLPNIGEFLRLPAYGRVSADDLYKYGGETFRHLLDNAPLRNDKKHVIIMAFTQYLYPDVRSIPSVTKVDDEDWHRDGCSSLYYNEMRNHILVTDCSARTEFNLNALTLKFDRDLNGDEFNAYVSKNYKELGIVPKKIPPNCFVTFDNHVHRRSAPTGYEFRFTFRITETDMIEPRSYAESIFESHFVASARGGWDDRHKKIERFDDRIVIYTKMNESTRLPWT